MTIKISSYRKEQQISSVKLIKDSNLSGTYYNGPSGNGVNATLTLAVSTLTIDGVDCQNGDRICLINQTNGYENGIYQISGIQLQVVLTRTKDFQTFDQMKPGYYFPVESGDEYQGTMFFVIDPQVQNVGRDSILIQKEALNSNVLLPVVDGDLAVFNGTSGQIRNIQSGDAEAGRNSLELGITDQPEFQQVHLGHSGASGELIIYPATINTGSIQINATSNLGDFPLVITNDPIGELTNLVIPNVGNSVGSFLMSSMASSDPGANIIYFEEVCSQADLAAGGSVILIPGSGTKQYKIIELFINSGGTNFSGGGGDRLGQVTDNTTVYSVIPAVSLQTLANARWGSTAMAFPASAAINTSTVAGQALRFKYSGGTTDYTAGSVTISGLAMRVA